MSSVPPGDGILAEIKQTAYMPGCKHWCYVTDSRVLSKGQRVKVVSREGVLRGYFTINSLHHEANQDGFWGLHTHDGLPADTIAGDLIQLAELEPA